MYLRFVLIRCGKTANIEMIVMRKKYTNKFLKIRDKPYHAGSQARTPRSVRKQKEERGEHYPEALLVFSQEGMGKETL